MPPPSAPPTGSTRSTWSAPVLVAFAVGALWRLIILATKWSTKLLLNDSLYYSAQARQLAHGTWFHEIFVDRPGAEHGPLTSILMAPLSWMSDPTPWQRCVTTACGIVTILVLAHLGRLLGGARAATAAAWIAALYPNLWLNDGLVMSESVATLALSVALVLVVRLVRGAGTTRLAAATGAVLGLAVLARSEIVLVAAGAIVLVAVAGGRRQLQWRRALVVAGGVAVVVLPWVAFNLARFERTVTLTTNDGTTLLGSYCDSTFAGPDMGGWSVSCVVDDPGYRYDEEPSVRSARQRSLAVHYAKAHAGRLPVVVAVRIARTLDLARLGSLVHQDVGEERWEWASWAGIVAWWLLAPVAAAGLRLIDRPARRVLLIPIGAVLVTTVVFYGAHRIRSSLEPVVVVAAAVQVAAWWARWRERPASASAAQAPDPAVGA